MPLAARSILADRGWDVRDVYEESLAGEVDAVLQARCQAEDRVLVTLDNDFADIRRYDPARSPGVIVLRPRNQSIRASLECLAAAVRALEIEPIAQALWIVEPERLRVRDFPSGA
jgi:predicted nuclease of predicted toxin-antitoxin system